MKNEYRKILDRAISNKSSIKKYLDLLKLKKINGLDKIINQLNDEVFEKINCLDCANCCSTTGPLLLEKDIEKLSKELKVKPNLFSEKHLRTDEDGDKVFKSLPCPFLGEDKRCGVYDFRPKACAEYPHTQQRDQYQKLKITYNNSTICPAVVLIVENLMRKYPLK